MPDATELEGQLLEKIPTNGTRVGNTRLIRELGWQEQDYWDVRNRLVDRGVLEVGRGKGGSVRRVALTTPVAPTPMPPQNSTGPSTAVESPTTGPAREIVLYEPIAKILD